MYYLSFGGPSMLQNALNKSTRMDRTRKANIRQAIRRVNPITSSMCNIISFQTRPGRYKDFNLLSLPLGILSDTIKRNINKGTQYFLGSKLSRIRQCYKVCFYIYPKLNFFDPSAFMVVSYIRNFKTIICIGILIPSRSN
jgi:hypothetical protein